jgi:hypothetical protein
VSFGLRGGKGAWPDYGVAVGRSRFAGVAFGPHRGRNGFFSAQPSGTRVVDQPPPKP